MIRFLYVLLLFLFLKFEINHADSIFESDSPPQLYFPNDTNIIPSNSTNFKDILYDKEKVTVFQFYNSWCGHCRRYAPYFKEFAKLTKNWASVIQISAINCVEETNEEICRDYEVTSYPTVRLFWTNVNSSENRGEHLNNLEFGVKFLQDAVLKFIVENLKTKSAPSTWPKLSKEFLREKEELQNHLSKSKLNAENNLPVVAIVEKNDSYVGQQIILELSKYQDKIEVLSFDIPSENKLNFTVDTSAATALLQLGPENTNSSYKILSTLPLSENNQTAYYLNYIDQNLFDNKLRQDEHQTPKTTPPTIEQSHTQSSNDTSQRANVQPEDVPLEMNDLYGAISYTLHHQIPLKKTINGRQLNILKRFFDLIERYFPSDDAKFTEFIKNLNQFIKSKEQELEINDYLNYLKKNDFDFKTKFQGWMTCRGSEPKYRGYTCSLWSLFHTLTLNEYLKEKDAQKWVNLHEVLFTMRDYIGNFFSCTDCAQHFTSMATNLENELKLPNSSVIWLWKAHNRVNKRLKGDLTEDPEHPKGVYPYQKDCPQCYLTNGEFNENEVWKYLVSRYGSIKKAEPKAIEEAPQSDKLVFESDPDSFKDNRVFNYTDYSLLIGLYILIAAIVMSVFFYLPMRIKRKGKTLNSRTKPANTYLDV